MDSSSLTNELPIGGIVMGLLGGLALFLFGMDQMSSALKLVTGDRMKRVLAALTTNRFTGVFAGALVTSIIQSSSVTTVLVVGFVSAGLMTFAQSIGVIMGANVGTTITAQIIAFKVTRYALLLVAAGFAMSFCLGNRRLLHEKVCWSVDSSLQALVSADRELAGTIIDAKDEVNQAADGAESHLLRRLIAAEPNRMEAFRIETDIIENYKRIYYFSKRIAKIAATQLLTGSKAAPIKQSLHSEKP